MSDFFKQKMRTYFQRIDFDKDGAITRNDFEGMGNRFVEADKLDAAAGAVVKEKLLQIWEKYISAVGGGEALTLDRFISAMQNLVTDKAANLDTLAGPLPLFFQAVDANNDGFIDSTEFGIFFKIIGLDPTMATSSFQAIDTNNDGLLSKEEFITAGTDFFFSDNTACPTKLFWGPLV